MATCKTNCIHYPVCGIWDRKVFVDYDNDIMSDFSDLPNVEYYCKNYLPNRDITGKWEICKIGDGGLVRTCSNCHITQTVTVYNGKVMFRYCPYCGAKMN
jgi:hypothetical protein